MSFIFICLLCLLTIVIRSHHFGGGGSETGLQWSISTKSLLPLWIIFYIVSGNFGVGRGRLPLLLSNMAVSVILYIFTYNCNWTLQEIFFTQGFVSHRAFIAAQGPMQNTVEDFWKMVLENHCTKIVMLTRLRENSRVNINCCLLFKSMIIRKLFQ